MAEKGEQGSPTPEKKKQKNRLGDFVLIRLLGKGGMGAVYEAVKVGSKKKYALKVLLSSRTSNPDAVARFEREIKAGMKMDHPAIVKVHEYGADKGRFFFAMDYVEGVGLDEFIEGRGLTPDQAAAVIGTVADALHHAHEQGIVHRDMKPSNLILDKEGKVYITDFGIATEESSATLTADGQIIGTPFYMSPEQALGKRGEIGPASDIYSLGVTFYEALTRTTPFRGEQMAQIFQKILTQDPLPPSQVVAGIPQDLDLIILKTLRKEPAKRYATARELAEDLVRFIEGKPVLARAMSPGERFSRLIKQNKGLFGTAAIAAVLLVTFLVYWVAAGAAARATAAEEAKKRKDDIAAAVKEGKAALKTRKYDDAQKAFEEVIALEENHVEARRQLARLDRLRRQAEDRKRRRADLEKARQIALQGAEQVRALDQTHLERQSTLAALMGYWDRYGPEYESSKVNEHYLAWREKDRLAEDAAQKALDLFNKALLLDPDQTEAHRGLATIHMAQAEARFLMALRTGDLSEVERHFLAVEQHDIKGMHAKRIEKLHAWWRFETPVAVSTSPMADRVTLYRADLSEGVNVPVEGKDGQYRLPPGSYIAEVEKAGYVTARAPFLLKRPVREPSDSTLHQVRVKLVVDAPKYAGMVYVPAGGFIMGGNGGVRGGPPRKVSLPAYFMDRCEVSGRAYKAFLDGLAKTDPGLVEKYRPRHEMAVAESAKEQHFAAWRQVRSDPPRLENWQTAWVDNGDGTWSPMPGFEDKPVGGVTFHAAKAYAESLGKRIPTSEEWEKAARGVDGRRYPWGDRFDEMRCGCSKNPSWNMFFPVDSMPEGASPYGCLHMSAQMAEWTSSDFDESHKINRGGGAGDESEMMRCASLDYTQPGDYNSGMGFRCVKDVD